MIKSDYLVQNAKNQRLFLIIAAPTKLVKYKIPVSKEPPPPRACTKGEGVPYDTPPYEHAAGLFPAECESIFLFYLKKARALREPVFFREEGKEGARRTRIKAFFREIEKARVLRELRKMELTGVKKLRAKPRPLL